MLRGFRWQFVALLIAVVVFGISVVVRITETPPPTPTPTATPAAVATAAPTPTQEANGQIAAEPTPVQVEPTPVGVPSYREALIGEVQRLNPLFADLNPVDRDITALIFEGLTQTNEHGETIPHLAKDWVVSADGLEYVVTLRDDVLWQDGTPFTADDVAYTMSILRSPDFPGSQALGEFWRTVETEKLDSYVIRFRLTQPLGSFLDALRIGILPVHALEGTSARQLVNHPFNLSPIGTGAYQLESLRADDEGQLRQVDLRVAPVYRQRPEGQQGYALDRVSFHLYDTFDEAQTALSNGMVDGLAARNRNERRPLLGIAFSRQITIHTAVDTLLGALIFNWEHEDTTYFREQRIRVALQTGIDRSSLVERSLPNMAVLADSPIMPGSWAYLPGLPWRAYDPGTAQTDIQTVYDRLPVAEATEEATPDPQANSSALFEFEILTPQICPSEQDCPLERLAREIETQLEQIGIAVDVVSVDLPTYQGRLDSGDFDTALVELALGDSADPDVYDFWHEGQFPDGMNYGGVNDRSISETLERARRESNGINRIQLYHDFQRAFVDRVIAIPLYYPLFTYAIVDQIDGVQLGFMGSPADRFRNIQDWTLR